MKKTVSLKAELVLLMFLAFIISFLFTIFLRNQGFLFKEHTKETRIQTIYSEVLNNFENELKHTDLGNQKNVSNLFHSKYSYLVGYNFYLVKKDGTVNSSSINQVHSIDSAIIKDGYRNYSTDQQDPNLFRIEGCDYIKDDFYLYYSYLMFDENDTKTIIIALLLSLFLFFIFILRRISYISTIRKSVNKIASGHLETRVPYAYHNDLRALAEDINEMATSMETEDQRRNEFLTNISHDIRTPLTTILGYLDMIQKKKYTSEEEKNHYINIMQRKGTFLASMLEDFFSYSKLSSKDIDLETTTFSLNELLRQFYEDEEPVFAKNHLSLSLHLSTKPLFCKGDPELIARTVSNLLSNANKYAKPNTTVYLENGQKRMADGMYHYILIKNIPKTPISPDEITLLFDRLYKQDKARKEEGTGLGLSIAKKIIELHNGKMEGFLDQDYLVFMCLLPN